MQKSQLRRKVGLDKLYSAIILLAGAEDNREFAELIKNAADILDRYGYFEGLEKESKNKVVDLNKYRLKKGKIHE